MAAESKLFNGLGSEPQTGQAAAGTGLVFEGSYRRKRSFITVPSAVAKLRIASCALPSVVLCRVLIVDAHCAERLTICQQNNVVVGGGCIWLQH
jgi:hypothetical protein